MPADRPTTRQTCNTADRPIDPTDLQRRRRTDRPTRSRAPQSPDEGENERGCGAPPRSVAPPCTPACMRIHIEFVPGARHASSIAFVIFNKSSNFKNHVSPSIPLAHPRRGAIVGDAAGGEGNIAYSIRGVGKRTRLHAASASAYAALPTRAARTVDQNQPTPGEQRARPRPCIAYI